MDTVICHCCVPGITRDKSSILLPVAPGCNVTCAHCSGWAERHIPSVVLSADDAVERVAGAIEQGELAREVLVWGPGEALLSATTFEVLRRMAWHYPGLPLTVCTNGLLLTGRLDELVRASVRNVLLLIPALTPRTAAKVYDGAVYRARRYTGEAAATLVLQQQWSGLLNAIEEGLLVPVAVPVIPGVNEHEVMLIGQRAGPRRRQRSRQRVVPSCQRCPLLKAPSGARRTGHTPLRIPGLCGVLSSLTFILPVADHGVNAWLTIISSPAQRITSTRGHGHADTIVHVRGNTRNNYGIQRDNLLS